MPPMVRRKALIEPVLANPQEPPSEFSVAAKRKRARLSHFLVLDREQETGLGPDKTSCAKNATRLRAIAVRHSTQPRDCVR
jgi:hypothetical protein